MAKLVSAIGSEAILRFSKANAKLKKLEKAMGGRVYSFDMLSGHTCPYARECHSSAVETSEGVRIRDGKHTLFRCFSASQEVTFPAVYASRKRNMEAILPAAADSVDRAADMLLSALPRDADIVRIHVAGDFKLRNYFEAWKRVAKAEPKRIFYAYTKSLPFWIGSAEGFSADGILGLPNFRLTASRGGAKDTIIDSSGLREARVVLSEAEADSLGLPIDADDSHAARNGGSFALLIHGAQPKGSEAGRAVRALAGKGSYGRK
jgi:hypothetical protein